MGKRKLSKAARFERMFKIWEYLRKNTDAEHPTTQAEMRKSEIEEYIGNKETFNRLIKDMAYAMNSAEKGYKPEKDWKIYFHDFKKYYGDVAEDCEEEALFDNEEECDEFADQTMHINGLYYNRTFSYDEINSIIEGILSTKTLDTKSARNLIEKVEENLTTKFYKKGPKQICKVMEPELTDREQLRRNLLTIQKAIDNNVQVAFRFNGYTYQKKLEPVRDRKDTVSPYYIVASVGRYYLLACKEVVIKGEKVRNMSIWRIDLMTDIEIPGENEALEIKGLPRIPKRSVENLPMEWTEDFQLKHLNMSYDKPIWITLKIKSPKQEDDPTRRIRADYTFLHDWFGDQFRFVETEKTAPYDDIVKVECSPFAMVHWALQYSDRVEVVAPEEIRNDVIEKVRNLNEKYELDKE
ncbi:MAG: WYL domain-containing protein [Lachnospiraceae bacterium]|nr:WYL domain-containing protein [Lachnospiraceae bacterium]